MSKIFRSHWQYITVILTMIATLLRLSFKEGEFRQKCEFLDTSVQVVRAESRQTRDDIIDINLNIKEIKTILKMMQKDRK